jgi:hypothetical protein
VTKPSTKAKLTIFFFITPLSPIAARMMIRSLIKIPHLFTFMIKVQALRLDFGAYLRPFKEA